MATESITLVQFGGVDSRSNPLTVPTDRALRCVNWAPNAGGWLELRRGYTERSTGTPEAVAGHSAIDYVLWDKSGKYLIVIKGKKVKRIDLDTGAETEIATLTSDEPCSFFRAHNYVHLFNGTDMGFYDGSTWRDYVGLRAPTDAEVAAVTVSKGVRSPSSAEQSAVVVAGAGTTGTFPATTGTGHAVFVLYYDPTTQDVGPAIGVGSRITFASGTTNKINLTSLPNLSTVDANWVKVLCVTPSGKDTALVALATAKVSATATQAGKTITVTKTAHGLSVGDIVHFRSTTDPKLTWIYKVATAATDTFTIEAFVSATRTLEGVYYGKAVTVANATTTGSIADPNWDTDGLIANSDRGLNKSTVGGAQPGYQLGMALYNPVTGDVGNFAPIGTRFSDTDADRNAVIAGLPDLSGEETELVWLIGRTCDGAEIEYIIIDAAGNWTYSANSGGSLIIHCPDIDTQYELPTRNTPAQPFVRVTWCGEKAYGSLANSPDLFYTDAEFGRSGLFLGKPAHCWPRNNAEKFPTYEDIVTHEEWDLEVWTFSHTHTASLVDGQGWRGPWNIGICGRRAVIKTPYGLYFLSNGKQLMKIADKQVGPEPVSAEYEKALLSKFGDSYKSDIELVYIRNIEKGIDHIKIVGKDADGNAYSVIHDFTLRDNRGEAQGRVVTYEGALANPYHVVQVVGADSKESIYALGSDGKLYELDEGGSDGGSEFTADYIGFANLSELRPVVAEMDYIGDPNVVISMGLHLNATTDTFDEMKGNTAAYHPEEEDDFLSQVRVEREARFAFVRMQLESHSADDGSDMSLNDPPHIPTEIYGRVYLFRPSMGDARGV